MHNFRKLDIWIKSMNLVTEIYQLTNTFPNHERFGLVSQIQRASISVPANIAEGSAKSSNKDFARFLEISIGSLLELETELIVATNLKYLNPDLSATFCHQVIELQRMITGFKNQLS